MLKDNGYGGTQLTQHAAACVSRMMRLNAAETPDVVSADRAAQDSVWLQEPSLCVSHSFADGSSSSFTFNNCIQDEKRGQICTVPGCASPYIGVTGPFHAKQHVKKYHDKTTANNSRLQVGALGTKGATLMTGFFAKAKAKGATDLEKESSISPTAVSATSAESAASTASAASAASGASSSTSPLQAHTARTLIPMISGQSQTDRLQQVQALLDENLELRRQLLRSHTAASASTEAAQPRQLVCQGITLAVPEPLHENYPFGLDSIVISRWRRPDEMGVIRSVECSGWSEDAVCSLCRDLEKVVELQKLQSRANDPKLYLSRLKDAFLTQSQLSQRRDHHRQLESMLRLELSKSSSKLLTAMHVATDLDRMMIAIQTNPKKLNVIAARLIKQKAKPATIAKMFEEAAKGYVPSARGKGHEQVEIEKAVALLILGGPRAVRVNQHASGGASASAAQNSELYRLPRFFGSSGPQNFGTLAHNIRVLMTLTPPTVKCAWHLAFDNVNIEERLRYDVCGGEAMGGLRGVARESSITESLIIKSFADYTRLQRAIERGDILLSKETTMLVAIRNSLDPVVIPLFASGTAKVKGVSGFNAQCEMVSAALALWDEQVAPVHGEVISIASDHDSTNGRTMTFFKKPMRPGLRHDSCVRMLLFDLYEGPNGVSVKFDEQHNGKNHRGKLVRKSGFVIHLIHFTRESLIDLCHSVTGAQIAELTKYFPPPSVDDHQNVGSMVRGFMEIAKLRGRAIESSVFPYPEAKTPKYAQMLLEVQPLAQVASCWEFLFTKHDASLSDHVLNLATLAGLLFVIRNHSKQFIPSQLYTAAITSIECVMNDILACQQKKYSDYYIWVASTHLLELLFGVFRTMLGALRNFDALQLEERASHASTLRSIYSKHPEWEQGSTRLKQSFDHWNTKSWTGSVDVNLVNVVDIWNHGIITAAERLALLPFYSKEEVDVRSMLQTKPAVTLLNPTGSSQPTENEDDEEDDTADVPVPLDASAGAMSEGAGEMVVDGPEEGPPLNSSVDPSAEVVETKEEGARVAADNLGSSVVDLEEAFAQERFESDGDEVDSPDSLSLIPVPLPTFIIDHPENPGEKTYIAALVSKLSKGIGELAKTTSRVGPGGGRVAHAAAHGAGAVSAEIAPANGAEERIAEKVYPDDHACAVLLIDGRPTAVVIEVVSLHAPLGLDSSRSGLSPDELLDPRSKVTVRPLKSRASAEGVLVFNGESSGSEIEVPGPFIKPLVLGLVREGQKMSLKIDIETMSQISDATWLTIMQPPATLPALLKKAPTSLLVKDADGSPLFQVGIAEAATTERLVAHKCVVQSCKEVLIDPNSAVGHSSYHALFTPTLISNPEPCPLLSRAL